MFYEAEQPHKYTPRLWVLHYNFTSGDYPLNNFESTYLIFFS